MPVKQHRVYFTPKPSSKDKCLILEEDINGSVRLKTYAVFGKEEVYFGYAEAAALREFARGILAAASMLEQGNLFSPPKPPAPKEVFIEGARYVLAGEA